MTKLIQCSFWAAIISLLGEYTSDNTFFSLVMWQQKLQKLCNMWIWKDFMLERSQKLHGQIE